MDLENKTVRPEPYHRPIVSPSPGMSEHYENPPALPPETALLPAQVKRLGHWGKSRHKALKRAWEGVCSPRAAIKLQCLDCCGEDEVAVSECADRCCPLWHFRPFQRNSGP